MRIVFVRVHPFATTSDFAIPAARYIHAYDDSIGLIGNPRVIVDGQISGENVNDIVGMVGFDGVTLMDDKLDGFGTIHEAIETPDE